VLETETKNQVEGWLVIGRGRFASPSSGLDIEKAWRTCVPVTRISVNGTSLFELILESSYPPTTLQTSQHSMQRLGSSFQSAISSNCASAIFLFLSISFSPLLSPRKGVSMLHDDERTWVRS